MYKICLLFYYNSIMIIYDKKQNKKIIYNPVDWCETNIYIYICSYIHIFMYVYLINIIYDFFYYNLQFIYGNIFINC